MTSVNFPDVIIYWKWRFKSPTIIAVFVLRVLQLFFHAFGICTARVEFNACFLRSSFILSSVTEESFSLFEVAFQSYIRTSRI